MVQKNLVSVIIPTFNAAKHIKSTINSILNQSYSDIEIIVVDDCSNDDTKNELKSYISNEEIKFYELDKNSGGPATPRNLGIKKSKGEWIAFCDSDDIWHPNKLELQIEYMITNNCEFSCTKKLNFIREEKIRFNSIDNYSTSKIGYGLLLLKDFIPTSSVVINKALIKGKEFNQSKIMVSVEDYLFWLSILKTYRQPCIKINKGLLYYRISNDQISKDKWKRIPKFVKMYYIHFSNQLLLVKGPFSLIFTFTHYTISLFQTITQRKTI